MASKKKSSKSLKEQHEALIPALESAGLKQKDKRIITMDEVLNTSLIFATQGVLEIYQEAKNLDSIIKTKELSLKPLKQELQDFMDVNGILADKQGTWLCTFQTQKKKRGDCFDFDAFCKDHPELWEKYKKPGDDRYRIFKFK